MIICNSLFWGANQTVNLPHTQARESEVYFPVDELPKSLSRISYTEGFNFVKLKNVEVKENIRIEHTWHVRKLWCPDTNRPSDNIN